MAEKTANVEKKEKGAKALKIEKLEKETPKDVKEKPVKPKETPKAEKPNEDKKKAPEIPEKKKKQVSQKRVKAKTASAKKWKGKDWFAILAPKIYGEKVLSETPTTDPDGLLGRKIEVNVADLTGQPNKFHMKMHFKVQKQDGEKLKTEFEGFEVLRDHVFRFVRKRAKKINMFTPVETKDGWKLQVSSVAILNRNTDSMIGTKIRHIMEEVLAKAVKGKGLEEMLKGTIAGGIQKSMRTAGNKVYPVRFCEISKIEVLKAG